MAAEKYDLISLGSGEAGKFLAWTYAGVQGKRCAVIEKQWIGGSCPNVACLPSKSFVHSASVVHETRAAASYGLAGSVRTEDLRADIAAVRDRKAEMVRGLVELHLGKFRDNKVDLIMGTGEFVGPKTIRVDGGRLLTADKIVVCTGSRALLDPAVPGLVEAKPLTHVTILNMQRLPPHLIVLGGGYVGLEFAQAFRRFGSQVTVVERHEHVLAREDDDVAEALSAALSDEGVRLVTSARVDRVEGECGSSGGVRLVVGSEVVEGTHLLAAVGRVPNTAGIGLKAAGIRTTPSGHVEVDEQLRTSVDGVFAVGDCAGSPHFTHVAYDDFRVVYSALTGSPRPGGTAGRQVPSTLFTSPELAQVGLREREARARGVGYRIAKVPMAAFLRSRTLGEGQTRGFAKVLVEADGDKILGFTALGPSAGELLPVVQLAMKLGVRYQEIADLIITHPTVCEGLTVLFSSVPPRGA